MMSLTLARVFSMFVYIRARFHFVLIGGNLTAQSMGSHNEIGGGIQILETTEELRTAMLDRDTRTRCALAQP